MRHFRKKLPPLEPLIAFEAAARHQSFSLAAKELHLSPAAISQKISGLEDYLGVRLFKRDHKSISLTRQGRDYQHSIAASLTQIANATIELRITDRESTLTVAVDQSISALWLMPRLRGFREICPEVKLRLLASDEIEDCLNDTTHVAIVYGDGKWHGYESRLVFPESVFPVCSPAYLER